MSGRSSPAPDAPLLGRPQSLRRLGPLVDRLPSRSAANLLAVLTVLQGLTSRHRWRVATAWSAAHARSRWDRHRLRLALFANHGRYIADGMRLWREDAEGLRRDASIEGRGHLEALRGGAILLGLHVGPPVVGRTLEAFGYPVRTAGRLHADGAPTWPSAEPGHDTPARAVTPRARAEGLQQARLLIQGGTWLYMPADGRGREAFRILVPGREAIVRAGWLALRRATGAPVLPVLCRREGARRIITIHPPLPAVSPDRAEDDARCRDVLSAILNDYAQHFPEQCRYVLISWRRELRAAQAR